MTELNFSQGGGDHGRKMSGNLSVVAFEGELNAIVKEVSVWLNVMFLCVNGNPIIVV
jgi:hypothetical protein